MVKAYNFIGSWQLFPEKGVYEWGGRPQSGTYRIAEAAGKKALQLSRSWVSLEREAFESTLEVSADEAPQACPPEWGAEAVLARFTDSITFSLQFLQQRQPTLEVAHEIQPNGYLKVIQQGARPDGTRYSNTEIYHRQMSVLPYSASVAGAVIRPTEEGVIRHKALTAMEEQTNMQLEQIRRQIELLALQAQEIHKRKELASLIYSAKLSFKPEIGQVYYLYQKKDGSHTLSLISPAEWGAAMPYPGFVAAVQLLADHTWKEL